MIFSLPWLSLVSPSKRLTLNLFMKWDYKQWEIHQTSPIPFCWKRLKLALGRAVSASCSSNLATTSVGKPSHEGERGCVSCQAAWYVFFPSVFPLVYKINPWCCIEREGREKEGRWGRFRRGARGHAWDNSRLACNVAFKRHITEFSRMLRCDPCTSSSEWWADEEEPAHSLDIKNCTHVIGKLSEWFILEPLRMHAACTHCVQHYSVPSRPASCRRSLCSLTFVLQHTPGHSLLGAFASFMLLRVCLPGHFTAWPDASYHSFWTCLAHSCLTFTASVLW